MKLIQMNSRIDQQSRQTSQRAIFPEFFITNNGTEIAFYTDRWDISTLVVNAVIDFSRLKGRVTPSLLFKIKQCLASYSKRVRTSTTLNSFNELSNFVLSKEPAPMDEICAHEIQNYFQSLNPKKRSRVGCLRSLLTHWIKADIPGLSTDLPDCVHKLRVPGNEKRNAVRTMDPHKGPLVDLEVQAIVTSASQLCSTNELSLRNYALLRVLLLCGGRSRSICLINHSDIVLDEAGCTMLMLPSHKRNRSAKPFPVPSDLVPVLSALREQDSALQPNLSVSQLPLFPGCKGIRNTDRDLGLIVRKISAKLNVISPRTGERINLSPRRFRYTFGTRVYEEGGSALVTAELLDHIDLQHVDVYVGNSHTIADRHEMASIERLTPILSRFKGTLVSNADEALFGDNPKNRISDDDDCEIGSCGTMASCQQRAPVACYTCPLFQPFTGAPHEQLLEKILLERKRLVKNGERRIAAVLDETIFAITQVIQKCREQSQEPLDCHD